MYPKRIKITILPIRDVIMKFLMGEIMNKIIKNTAIAKHIHTFFVVFEYSTIIIEMEGSINNTDIFYIDIFLFLS